MLHRSIVPMAVLTSLTAACSPAFTAEQPAQRPNIVVILADDLGYGDLACYGHSQFTTPNLDRMAEQGARLTQYYVPVPYCAPSRATLLTGRYPWRNGMTGNPAPDANPQADARGIADSELLLGEVLRTAGYATACIGKWHLGHRPEFYPTRHGFDEYFGILYSNDMRPVQLIEGDEVIEYPVVQATLTQRYTARALDFIERNKDRSFFLYLPHAMPHKPLAASEEFYKQSGAGLYGDVIAELDWSVGQVLEKLNALGLDDKTLVVFTSDNGPWFGGSSGGLRGMKSKTWEGGLRVPCIVRWPGQVPPGQTIGELCGAIDLFPTVLAAAGLDLPEDRAIDGRNLLPMLEQKAASPHEALFAMQGGNLMAVRSGPWKLHVRLPGRTLYREPAEGEQWIDPRGPDGVTILAPCEQYKPHHFPGLHSGAGPRPMMLFNLGDDPAEQHDVAARHPQIVERLKQLYDAESRAAAR